MIIIRAHDGAYFAQRCAPGDAARLLELCWRRHPSGPDVWWTKSPLLAAPLWACVAAEDRATRDALGPWAWNYQTSFVEGPIAGAEGVRLPEGHTLYPFQVGGVQRALMRPKMLICDQPGLGKSPEALAVLNCVRPARTLIGCPTFLATNWAEECERWCVDAQPIAVLDGAKKAIPERGIVILPYSRGHSFEKQLLAGPPCDLVICDEFHWLKDPSARRSGPWFRPGGLVERARRALLLSGTPMPNNPVELYAPLRVAAPDLLGGMTRDKFQETYCSTVSFDVAVGDRGRKIEVQKIVGKSREALNAELRAGGAMVRRLKDAVLPQLPPKNLFFVHMRPDAEIEQLVREEADLFEQLQTRILPSTEMMALRGHVANVRRRLGALKAPKIAEYVRSLFDGGEDRVVLFMLHLEAIEIVRRAFERSGIVAHVLTGAEAPSERFARVRDFQAPGGRKLVIGQVTAAGEGLTMTASRFAVLGEISWTPGKNEQAVDRVHRITQTRHVDCPVLTFPHAIEEKVIRVNARKALDARAVLDVDLMEGVG